MLKLALMCNKLEATAFSPLKELEAAKSTPETEESSSTAGPSPLLLESSSNASPVDDPEPVELLRPEAVQILPESLGKMQEWMRVLVQRIFQVSFSEAQLTMKPQRSCLHCLRADTDVL